MQKFLTTYFSAILLGSAIGGILFSESLFFLNDYTAEILMLVLFTSFLGLRISEISHINWKQLFFYAALYSIALPILFYIIFSAWIDPIYGSVFFLFLALPSGMTNPAMAKVFALDLEKTTAFTVITSLSFPFLFTLFSPILPFSGEISGFFIFSKVATFIIAPFFLALFFQKFLPRFSQKISSFAPSVAVVGLSVIILGILAFHKTTFLTIFSSFDFVFWGTGMFLAYSFLAGIGYALPAKNKQDRWTNTLMFWGTNPVLFLVLASQFFPPEISLGAFFAEIFWIIFQIGFSLAYAKWYREKS